MIGTERRRPALGLLGDQAAAAGIRLPPHGQQPTLEVDVNHMRPATSLIRNAVVAKIITQSPQA